MDRKRLVIVAMAGGMLLITLDFFGLTVALPKIGEDLKASTSSLLWVVNAYLLAFASPIIAVGRLADIVGRRKVVLTGIVIFVVASAACGVAQSPAQLIVFRLVQGVGGGTIFATALSVVSNAFPADQRSSAIGIWSGIGCVGSAIGPFVAGVLTQTASWRWFFFLNVPIGIGVIILTLIVVEESRDETFSGRIDWTGFALITAGMVLFILALQDSGTEGWGSPLIIGSLVASVAFLFAFVIVELRVKDPLIEFGLFRTLPFAGAAVVSFVGNWMFGSILFFLTLYLQEVLDLKPLETGLVFLTFTVPLVALPPVTGRMVTKYGPQILMAVGEALITVGMVSFLFLDATSGLGLVILGLVIAGVGQGFSFNISNSAGMEAIPDNKAGIGSGVLSLVRLMGIIVGLALSGAVFKSVENHSLFSSFETASGKALSSADKAEIRGLLSGSDAAIHKLTTLAPQLRNQVEAIVNKAFVHGLHAVMILSIIVCALSVPAALWGRAKANKGTHRLAHLAHPLWPHLWKREPVPAGRPT
jgi:EmrB/QacA subfamily drug resistance transporter